MMMMAATSSRYFFPTLCATRHLPLLLLLHLIAITLLCPYSATSSALPSPPQPHSLSADHLPPAPNPAPKPPPAELQCFEPGREDHKPVNIDDCQIALDMILHESPGPMTYQKFGHAKTPPDPTIYTVPSAWRVDQCSMVLSSVNEEDVEEFRFVDVAQAAQRVVRECSQFTKLRLGGVVTLGTKTFFVTVDAPPDTVGRGGRGEGNGTAVGMGMGKGTGMGRGGVPVIDVGSYSRGRRLLV